MALLIKKCGAFLIAATLASSITIPPAFAKENAKSTRIPLEDVQRFSTAINQIKNYYVKPVKDKALFDSAIRGMLTSLDPHSNYLDEDSFKELQSSTMGEFGGLGIEVTMEQGVIKVIAPLDGTPAQKAGIKSGDYIIRLGKTPVKGLSLRKAVKLMRGKKGAPIKLTVLRKGEKKPLYFNVVRDVILVQSVKSKLLENHYAYVQLTHFQALTAKDMLKAVSQLKKLSKNQIHGLILDLRNNPGGLLDSAIQTSDAFIHNDSKGKEELIVYTKGRLPGSKFTAVATPGDILNNAPMVVLINGGSASGSEIVAGALKDNNRAIVLGTRSFGKGSVQTVLPLDSKRGIKLTTALYYTPSGNSIQAKGVTPDITVDEVSIPKKKTQEMVAMISEADLQGHLANDNQPSSKGKKSKAEKTGIAAAKEKLIHKDYQLYEALNVLKGMVLVSNN